MGKPMRQSDRESLTKHVTSDQKPVGKTWLRLLEMACVFLAFPALIASFASWPILPLLWLVAGGCGYLLLRDPNFDRRNLWRSKALSGNMKTILLEGVAAGLLLTGFVALFFPELLFSLVKQKPLLWLAILLFYPLLSVYPQEVIYRAFFFHRYRRFFPKKWALVATNALLFGYMHIVFHNGTAVALTLVGGLIFALSYERRHSLLFVSLQHALYGGLVFTVGLGRFFSSGTIATVAGSLPF